MAALRVIALAFVTALLLTSGSALAEPAITIAPERAAPGETLTITVTPEASAAGLPTTYDCTMIAPGGGEPIACGRAESLVSVPLITGPRNMLFEATAPESPGLYVVEIRESRALSSGTLVATGSFSVIAPPTPAVPAAASVPQATAPPTDPDTTSAGSTQPQAGPAVPSSTSSASDVPVLAPSSADTTVEPAATATVSRVHAFTPWNYWVVATLAALAVMLALGTIARHGEDLRKATRRTERVLAGITFAAWIGFTAFLVVTGAFPFAALVAALFIDAVLLVIGFALALRQESHHDNAPEEARVVHEGRLARVIRANHEARIVTASGAMSASEVERRVDELVARRGRGGVDA